MVYSIRREEREVKARSDLDSTRRGREQTGRALICMACWRGGDIGGATAMRGRELLGDKAREGRMGMNKHAKARIQKPEAKQVARLKKEELNAKAKDVGWLQIDERSYTINKSLETNLVQILCIASSTYLLSL
jgi:hypothetical protein